jgi:hypothetical protein
MVSISLKGNHEGNFPSAAGDHPGDAPDDKTLRRQRSPLRASNVLRVQAQLSDLIRHGMIAA